MDVRCLEIAPSTSSHVSRIMGDRGNFATYYKKRPNTIPSCFHRHPLGSLDCLSIRRVCHASFCTSAFHSLYLGVHFAQAVAVSVVVVIICERCNNVMSTKMVIDSGGRGWGGDSVGGGGYFGITRIVLFCRGAIDRSLDEIIENWNLKQFKLLQLEDMGE